MNLVKKVVNADAINYYTIHLNIVNALLNNKLSTIEIEILAAFMALDKQIVQSDMFNTFARKQVKEQLGGMSAGSLSNHLRSMQEKGFLQKEPFTNKITIVKYLIPEDTWQGYQIKLIKKENHEPSRTNETSKTEN